MRFGTEGLTKIFDTFQSLLNSDSSNEHFP